MAESLTLQQQMAVDNRGGKLLVSAAAGSGKTKVLVDRLLSYIMDADSPANIDDFLIITFTKAAATELRGKIAAKIAERLSENPENRHLQTQLQRVYLAKISTVHSFCSDILREYAYRLDIAADFRIAEEKECQEIQLHVLENLLDCAYTTMADDADFCTFVDTQGLGRDDYLIPQIVLSTYNSSKCHLNPDAWLDWCIESFDTTDAADASETIWGRYLLDDLRKYLRLQKSALEKCVVLARCSEGMEKPAALLSSTIEQLERLEQCTTWDAVLANHNIDYGRLTFPKSVTDLELAEKIKLVRETCKKGVAQKLKTFSDSSDVILHDLQQSASAARGLVKLVRQFSEAYDKQKLARRVMDYADLEHRMLDLLLGRRRSEPTSIAKELGLRFREIMVDEYQDTNEVQDAIFGALTNQRNNCFMVGDVKQSIYQFRLADPSIFISKYNSYADAQTATIGEGRKVLLSSNFRSSGGVISAVNHVFGYSMSPDVGGLYYGEDEMLREGIPHVLLPDPEVELYAVDVQEDTYAEEAAFVAERIYTMLDGQHMVRNGDVLRPIVADDIVILLRSPGSTGAHYVYALEQKGIRCTAGKGIDLLQTEEVGVLRSLLQVISNPLQDIPLVAVLMSPVFGFSADEMASMRSRNRFSDVYGLLQETDNEKAVNFLQVLAQLRQDARFFSLAQLIQKIFIATNLDNIYGAMADGEIRKSNLLTFAQMVSEYESSTKRDLNQFLSYLDLIEDDGLRIGANERESGAVTIMSIHTSKGLEFPVVFLCGLSKRFNLENTRERVLCDKDLGLGMCCVDTSLRVRYANIAKQAISKKMIADSISEEMRILYVAMTRARDRLIMTYASNKLEDELASIVVGLDMYDPALLTGHVTCAGAWILQSALRRTEAGELFALGGHPECAAVCDTVWHIRVVQRITSDNAAVKQREEWTSLSDDELLRLKKSLTFRYPNEKATMAPSKLTATQLKGRLKDIEVAENAVQQSLTHRSFRQAAFVKQQHSAKSYGTAIHAVMQYIDFKNCGTLNEIQKDIARLVSERLITPEQAALVDPCVIHQFFETELGGVIIRSDHLLREFKFSVLDDASNYIQGLKDEKILLQGVVDCAIIESDGITIVDFKTDKVTEKNIADVAKSYYDQVRVYALALKKIYGIPVKSAVLYFFRMNQFVPVECN